MALDLCEFIDRSCAFKSYKLAFRKSVMTAGAFASLSLTAAAEVGKAELLAAHSEGKSSGWVKVLSQNLLMTKFIPT